MNMPYMNQKGRYQFVVTKMSLLLSYQMSVNNLLLPKRSLPNRRYQISDPSDSLSVKPNWCDFPIFWNSLVGGAMNMPSAEECM